jgi:hypothetical protein
MILVVSYTKNEQDSRKKFDIVNDFKQFEIFHPAGPHGAALHPENHSRVRDNFLDLSHYCF